MRPELSGVFLIPAQGDPGGFLTPGSCGAIGAPAIMSFAYEEIISPVWRADGTFSGVVRGQSPAAIPEWRPGPLTNARFKALPLLWEGKVVQEGWSRLIYALPPAEIKTLMFALWPTHFQVDQGALASERLGLTARTVRLVWVEGKLVEVPAWSSENAE